MRRFRRREPNYPGFEPIRVTEVELADPLPKLESETTATGHPYRRAQSLVRLHGFPLGLVDLELPPTGLEPAAYAAEIWKELKDEICAHLQKDGLPSPEDLTSGGIPIHKASPCQEARVSMLAQAPLVSVVIPSRDAGVRIASCLLSVLASEYPRERYEIIVVDNVPRTSDTEEFLHTFDQQIRYMRSDVPGSASARNRGLAAANGDIVAFIDDDIIVDRYWLAELARGFTYAPNVACVTQLILPLALDTPAQVWFEEYGGAAKGFVRRIYDLTANRPDDPLFPFNAGSFGSGGSMAFDRVVLEALGGFDPALGNGTPTLGGVDIESFFRVIVEGYSLVYEPAAIVWHRHRPEYAVLRSRIYGYGVGLTAFLLRSIIAKPRLSTSLVRQLPRGVAFALFPSSEKHREKSASYPSELRWAEVVGMMYGPVAYARSARRFGRPALVRRCP